MTPRSATKPKYTSLPPSRRLRLEVDLEFDGRIPLPDGFVATALADALLIMDEQGLVFPGVEWPRHLERLHGWFVRVVGSGHLVSEASVPERFIEQRRQDGDVWPRESLPAGTPAALSAEIDEVLAAIDDLEPLVMEHAEAAWIAVTHLRHAAAQLATPGQSVQALQAAVEQGRKALASSHKLGGVLSEPLPPT
ncbi:hypothetical protein [Falsiroseomonas ponticola]|uniref:hypothetical protein n=1 Tax=Falsiroseomonas ponticola TaxID=2786951 RepID=UPI0019317EFB|nr:hypothetical protein [Roseomonas ponticola]